MAGFITVDAARLALRSYGIDMTGIDNVMLSALIDEATDLMDVSTPGTLKKQRIVNEFHVLPAANLVTDLFHFPIRSVQEMSVLLGAFGGKRQIIKITTLPNEVVTSQVSSVNPPIVQGDVSIDRDNNIIAVQIVYPAVGIVNIASFRGYSGLVTYTAGYDDGTVQDDGISLPAPKWLLQATKLQLRHMIHFVNAELDGINEVESIQEGQVKLSIISGMSFDIAPVVQKILDANFNPYGMA